MKGLIEAYEENIKVRLLVNHTYIVPNTFNAECSINPAARPPPPHTHASPCFAFAFVELASSRGIVECVDIMPNRLLSITNVLFRYTALCCGALRSFVRGAQMVLPNLAPLTNKFKMTRVNHKFKMPL